MTEAEWLCEWNPDRMLTVERVGGATLRKLGHCGIACLRRLRRCEEFEDWANAIAVGEATIDRAETIPVLVRHHRNWSPPVDAIQNQFAIHLILYGGLLHRRSHSKRELLRRLKEGVWRAAQSLTFAESGGLPQEVMPDTTPDHPANSIWIRVRTSQADIVREVIGNPFRPVVFDPSWRTSTAVAIAHGIYDDKAFDRLPILADALQDAGCENADLLSHLRGDGPHVRGCWALDLVLGKE